MTRSSASHRAPRLAAVTLLGGLLAGALSMAGGARLERADFTFNNGTEVTTLDPATVSGVPEGRIIRALFEGLCVKHPSTIEALPGAADRWSLSEDRTVYTFHIREGARWSNGDPLTAHDFVFSWERFLNPLTAAEYAYQLWYVAGAREYTHLVDDFAYQGEWDQNLWVEERDGGRLRIGCSGYLLTDGDRERQVVVTVREGDELAGKCLNLSSRQPLTPPELIARLAQETGRDFHFHPRPFWLSQLMEIGKWIVKRVGGRRDASFPSFRDLKSRSMYPALACRTARNVLGWTPNDDADDLLKAMLPPKTE